MNMITSRKTQNGFTIIETLVAITILMIAIAGPLTIASQALHAAQDAKNQMIATNLAQETVEEIRNLKDNNVANSSLFDLFYGYTTNTANANVGPWEVETDSDGSYAFASCAQIDNPNCNLYLDPSQGYIYEQTFASSPTPFKRSFSMMSIGDHNNEQGINEYVLTVTVSWTTGTVPNQIQIVELLTSSSR